MATEHIPQIGRALREWGQAFHRATEDINNGIKQMQMELNQIKESEDNTMHHNVTIAKEENKVIEEYWVMRAVKEDVILKGTKKQMFKERKSYKEPTIQEIAQFLSETQADFVSVERNYRFSADVNE